MFRSRKNDDVSRLTRQQKERVKQFVGSTGASERDALAALQGSEWEVAAALARYQGGTATAARGGGGGFLAALTGHGRLHYHHQHQGGQAVPPQQPPVDPIQELFLRYKDPDSDMILADGISQLCEDLQVEPQDIVMLVLSWHLNAATMCEYSRHEFTSGLRSLRVTSVDALKALLPSFRRELQDENVFRQIYNFAFAWAKEKGQKCLALDTAVGMWQLLLGYRSWPHVDHWCDFVRVQHNKAISKDTWSQLFEFSRLTQGQLEQYDEGGAWPYLIDEFVDSLRAAGSLPPA
ncbi:hypothetical protein CLOM_g11747 [Closterium sp. NIES-68]|nr:hypothetical protein CLOM_g11747 [Closterium sp. NIES-68]GJP76537.1 hypothetical protein CLOP_g6968 [Closterium sp. NIES-67]